MRSFLLNNAVIAKKVVGLNINTSKSLEESFFNDNLIKPYIPQIKTEIRQNAEQMSVYYKIFYMLENHIRIIIESLLKEERGPDWWELAVPEAVRNNANQNKRRELEAGFSLRSTEMLPYTNFGELGDIVRENWDDFWTNIPR